MIFKTKHKIIPGNIIPSLFHLQKSKGVLCKNKEQDMVIKWKFIAEIFLLKTCLRGGSLEPVGFIINNAINLFIYHRIQFKLYSTRINCHRTSNASFFQRDDLPLVGSKILLRLSFIFFN